MYARAIPVAPRSPAYRFVALGLVIGACGAPAPADEMEEAPLVYGQDRRVDADESTPGADAVALVGPKAMLDCESDPSRAEGTCLLKTMPAYAKLMARSLLETHEAREMCPSEPFFHEAAVFPPPDRMPIAGLGTAVLIDPTSVLKPSVLERVYAAIRKRLGHPRATPEPEAWLATAAHSFSLESGASAEVICGDMVAIFDYTRKVAKDHSEVLVRKADIYSCHHIVYRSESVLPDVAVVALDRIPPNRRAVRVARLPSDSLTIPVTVVGHFGGKRLKREEANVRPANAQYRTLLSSVFQVDATVERGVSGAPVFLTDCDGNAELLGVIKGSIGADMCFETDDGHCRIPQKPPDDDTTANCSDTEPSPYGYCIGPVDDLFGCWRSVRFDREKGYPDPIFPFTIASRATEIAKGMKW